MEKLTITQIAATLLLIFAALLVAGCTQQTVVHPTQGEPVQNVTVYNTTNVVNNPSPTVVTTPATVVTPSPTIVTTPSTVNNDTTVNNYQTTNQYNTTYVNSGNGSQ